MKAPVLAVAGLTLLGTAPSTEAFAAMSPHQAYKSCRAELRGIGRGRGAPQRRFNMIEHCVQRKLGRVAEATATKPTG